MELYSFLNNDDWQLYKKYCVALDRQIDSVVCFIDTFNPNYMIINRSFKQENINAAYYTRGQLEALGILYSENGKIYVNLNKMMPHQIVENTYESSIWVIDSDSIEKEVHQGYAIRLDGFNSEGNPTYTIISLASSGSYYILTNTSCKDISGDNANVTLTWSLLDNATDIYGKDYKFSVLLPGSRLFYRSNNNNHSMMRTLGVSNPISIASFRQNNIIIGGGSISAFEPSQNPDILWTVGSSNIDSEFCIYTNGAYETVCCDQKTKVTTVRVDESPQSRYTIDTNLDLSLSNLFLNLY